MKPLLVLISVFIITLLVLKLLKGSFRVALSARVAMAAMLLFTAIGHFAFTKGMALMLPDFIPQKELLVYLTGIIEVVAAIGLLIPGLKILTGWLLIAFFLLILPANIYAAIKHVDYQNANFNGQGLDYLWFRIPLQIIFILWIYFFCCKPERRLLL
jgi:uncharacterized membrane protein